MRNLCTRILAGVLCLQTFCAYAQNKTPQPAPSPAPSPAPGQPSPAPQPGGDVVPVVGDSSWSTSPFSGKLLDPSSGEGRSYSNLLNRYHVMKAEEAWLQYIKACGSAEDIKSAEARLATDTAAFNKALEDYVYGYSADPGALGFGSFGPTSQMGAKQLSGGGTNPKPRSPVEQRIYDGLANDVMAQLAKDDKQEPYPAAQCPPKTSSTLPGPNPGSGSSSGTVPGSGSGSSSGSNSSPSPTPSPSPSPSPSPGGGAGGSMKTLIGIVLPSDTRPGDTVTATVVKDPQSYSSVPGLRVIQATVPLATDAQGESTLIGVVVNTGDGEQQPATQPLRFKVPANAAQIGLTVSAIGSDTTLDTETVPLTTPPATPEPQIWEPSRALQIPASAYTTSPAEAGGAVQAIHGPVSGDSTSTRVLVDEKPASVVAESPRAAFFDLPEDTAAGAHKLTVTEDGQAMTSFHVAVLDLKLSADLLRLQKGQSTEMHAAVEGADAIPASAWQPGSDSDLVAPKTAEDLLPAKSESTRPAAVVLRIENKSGDAIKIPGAKANLITLPLEQKDFANGTYTLDEKVQSVRTGGFNITAEVTPLLAPITGETPPGRTSAADLSHTTAYYVASTETLHVRNADSFREGIGSGKFLVSWSEGATTATIHEADGSTVRADVLADDPKDAPPEPKIGDVKYVEKQKINSVDGSTGTCQKIPALLSDKQFIGRREVHRHYTELADTGDDSGTETYQSVARNDFYDATDCTSGYSNSSDIDTRYVLTVGSWPKT